MPDFNCCLIFSFKGFLECTAPQSVPWGGLPYETDGDARRLA